MTLGDKKAREKFKRFEEKVDKFLEHFHYWGATAFGILGFILGFLSFATLMIASAGDDSGVPYWLMTIFGAWLGGILLLSFISIALTIIYHNKKNWGKK